MIEVEIKDLPGLVNWADSLVRIAREVYKQDYTIAGSNTHVKFNPPLVTMEGLLQEKFLSAAINHPASFKALLEENEMGLVMINDVTCEHGYFNIAIIHGRGDDQICINVHSDKKAWSEMGEDIASSKMVLVLSTLLEIKIRAVQFLRKCLSIFRK